MSRGRDAVTAGRRRTTACTHTVAGRRSSVELAAVKMLEYIHQERSMEVIKTPIPEVIPWMPASSASGILVL